MSDRLVRLRETLGTIHDLGRIASLMAWDQETMMPLRGGGEYQLQRPPERALRLSLKLLLESGWMPRSSPPS